MRYTLKLVLAAVCILASASLVAQSVRRVKHAPLDDISDKGRLAVLEDALQYPPESRPIDSTYWALLHPWSVDTATRPMIPVATLREIAALRNAGVPRTDKAWSQIKIPASAPSYRFEMNKTILAGLADQLHARLVITGSGAHIDSAEVIGSTEFGSPNLGAVPFSCEASGGPCHFTWQAPSADKKYWGDLHLQVTVHVDGMPGHFVIGESFYSSPMVAGRFTGDFQDRLENGSLVIDAAVSVQSHMACFVSANLYSADSSTPLQHAERRMIVDPSMKTISFTFFGKIFRDYGDSGTFRVQDLQAQCKNLPYPPEWFLNQPAHQAEWEAFQKNPPASSKEPSRIYFDYDTHSFTTHSYPLTSFSDAEWQSPEKTRAIQSLKNSLAGLAAKQ